MQGFLHSVEINNPILGDGAKIVVHNITKDLKMFALVISHRIKPHHEKINLPYLYNYHKITNEDLSSLNKFDPRHWSLPTIVTHKTWLAMCEYHKEGQDSTLFEQLKGCLLTFSQSKSRLCHDSIQRLQNWYPSSFDIF